VTDDMRARLYDAYSSTHAGVANEATGAIAFGRDILPHLPDMRDVDVMDLGCGQGQLVKQLTLHGYKNARGVDIGPEQVMLAHSAGVTQVELGDYRDGFNNSKLDVVTATDFFEHLTKFEVLEALDRVHAALRPAGVLILRVPNSVSPFGGNFRHGDITHETSFTASNLRQLGTAARFDTVRVLACPPAVHGAKSLVRHAVWKAASGAMKLTLAAETGALRGHLVTQNIVAVMRKGS
jgi:2-polyprenyl-3-methyl-5-hydroxy-6-metoxy-1,4-benzoquinol methylase